MRRLAALLLLLPLLACGAEGGGGEVTLRVYAAASLTGSFTTLASRFERDHPETEVELNFGPSSGLAQQIRNGAPADVFAAASPATMDPLVADGEASDSVVFARNSLVVAVPAEAQGGDPAGVETLGDLARPGLKVALCQAQVPCGTVAAEVLENAGVSVRAATEEADVRAVLTKVRLGEVDAGLVYVTDARDAADEVRAITIPEAFNATTDYPVAPLTRSRHASLARAFVDHVRSAEGARVLRAAGFELS